MKNQNQQTRNRLTGYLRLNSILELLPISKSTWWAGIEKGRYPKPVKLGPRTTAWKIEDIELLMKNINNND